MARANIRSWMKRSRQFLIVEGEPKWRRIIEQALGAFGHLHSKASLSSALKWIPKTPWMGSVISSQLPDGPGMDLVYELRERHPQVPLLIVIDESDDAPVDVALTARAAVLKKPLIDAGIEAFGRQAIAYCWTSDARVAALVDQYSQDQSLEPREVELVAAAVAGHGRSSLVKTFGVTENTLKSQIRNLLTKSGAASLDSLANDVLRQAFDRDVSR